MAWATTSSATTFLDVAGDFLRREPVANTVLLTAAEYLRLHGPTAFGDQGALFGWWSTGSAGIEGAFLHTPPRALMLSAVPDEAVSSLLDSVATLNAVNAETRAGEVVAEQWRTRTGVEPDVHVRMRLFRLGVLTPPDPAPRGQARTATPDDRELLIAWNGAFGDEIGEERGNLASIVDDRISYGGFTVWEVDGLPVAMAGRTRPAAGMVRVGPVYTPPEHRRHGYAAGATVAVSEEGRRLAADVVLFTDLSNPTSNALYKRLGFEAVQDRVILVRS